METGWLGDSSDHIHFVDPNTSTEYFDSSVEMGIFRKLFAGQEDSDGKVSIAGVREICASLGMNSTKELDLLISHLEGEKRFSFSDFMEIYHLMERVVGVNSRQNSPLLDSLGSNHTENGDDHQSLSSSDASNFPMAFAHKIFDSFQPVFDRQGTQTISKQNLISALISYASRKHLPKKDLDQVINAMESSSSSHGIAFSQFLKAFSLLEQKIGVFPLFFGDFDSIFNLNSQLEFRSPISPPSTPDLYSEIPKSPDISQSSHDTPYSTPASHVSHGTKNEISMKSPFSPPSTPTSTSTPNFNLNSPNFNLNSRRSPTLIPVPKVILTPSPNFRETEEFKEIQLLRQQRRKERKEREIARNERQILLKHRTFNLNSTPTSTSTSTSTSTPGRISPVSNTSFNLNGHDRSPQSPINSPHVLPNSPKNSPGNLPGNSFSQNVPNGFHYDPVPELYLEEVSPIQLENGNGHNTEKYIRSKWRLIPSDRSQLENQLENQVENGVQIENGSQVENQNGHVTEPEEIDEEKLRMSLEESMKFLGNSDEISGKLSYERMITEEIIKLKSKLLEVSHDLIQARAQLREKSFQVESSNSQVEKIKSLESQLENMRREDEFKLKVEAEKLERRRQEKERENSHNSQIQHELSRKLVALREENSNLKSENSELKTEIFNLKEDLVRSRNFAENSKTSRVIEEEREKFSKLQVETFQLRRKLEDSEKKIREMETRNSESPLVDLDFIENSGHNLVALQDENFKLKTELEFTKSRLEFLETKSEHQEDSSRRIQLESDLNLVTKRMYMAEQQIVALERSKDQISAEFQRNFDDQQRRFDAEESKFKLKIEESQRKFESAQREFQIQLESWKGKFQLEKSEKEELENQIFQLENELNEMKNLKDNLQFQLENQKSNFQLEFQDENASEELEQLKREFQEFRENAEKLATSERQEREQLEDDRAQLEDALVQLHSKLKEISDEESEKRMEALEEAVLSLEEENKELKEEIIEKESLMEERFDATIEELMSRIKDSEENYRKEREKNQELEWLVLDLKKRVGDEDDDDGIT